MNYRWKHIIVASVCIVFALSGCAYMSLYPQPTSGFAPRPDYQVSYDKAWDTVLEVLGNERVGTVYQAKEKGRIGTCQ
jgi:hypothetical protein